MKGIFTILIISLCSGTSWCQSDSTEIGAPKIFHISTVGTIDSVFLDDTFTVLSLVSPEMFDKWNSADLERKYDKKSVLIVVASQDSDTKTKFVTSFYRNLASTGSKRKAYKQATKEIGPNGEIKHILILTDK